jgi:hypothetical protein
MEVGRERGDGGKPVEKFKLIRQLSVRLDSPPGKGSEGPTVEAMIFKSI